MTTTTSRLVRVAVAIVATSQALVAQSTRSSTVAFVNVHVLPMDSARALRNRTVIVRDGIVTAFGPAAATPVPSGATVVAGDGKRFLMPGLVDFHTHSVDAMEMAEYLRAGVTTIVNMGHATTPQIDAHHRAERAGAAVPRAYFGRRLNQPYGGEAGVSTAEQGRAAVQSARADGYDFIKAYGYLAPPTFFAITREARTLGLPVFGHQVVAVGLETTIDSGVSVIAHLEELLSALGPTVDTSRIPSLVAMLKQKRTVVTTTLVSLEAVARQWGRPDVIRQYLSRADSIPLGPRWRPLWEQGELGRLGLARADTAAMRYEAAKAIARALAREGVPMLAGTDAPGVAGVFAGVSMRDEFRNLLATGLRPFEVLAAATRVPSEIIAASIPGATNSARLAVGTVADLLLTETNPLDDPLAATRPQGVLVRGEWIPSEMLPKPVLRFAAAAAPPTAQPADVASDDAIVASLYDVISGPVGKKRDWNRFRSLFAPSARLMQINVRPDSSATIRQYTPDEYAGLATRFEETGFFEREVFQTSERFGALTHRFSTYESRRTANDSLPYARGINSIQLLRDRGRWWIVTVLWDAERAGNPLPSKYLPGSRP